MRFVQTKFFSKSTGKLLLELPVMPIKLAILNFSLMEQTEEINPNTTNVFMVEVLEKDFNIQLFSEYFEQLLENALDVESNVDDIVTTSNQGIVS